MKVDRHGKAKVLSVEEIALLLNEGVPSNYYRALFGICLYTACRIREGCTLRTTDVYERKGIVLPDITFRKGETKGKLSTRTIPVIEDLRLLLLDYYPSPRTWFLFAGADKTGHINPESASRVLKKACQRLGIRGVSTHSFRRTALTQMSNAGIPLRVIQEVSGHRDLGKLQRYLEVKPEQVRGAVSALSMLTPVNKRTYPDRHPEEERARKRLDVEE